MRDEVGLCEECLACRHPGIYCKYRDMCIVVEELKDRNLELTGDKPIPGIRPH